MALSINLPKNLRAHCLAVLGERILRPTSSVFPVTIVTLHGLFCWVFGSVLWVDAASYINIADALRNFNSIPGIVQGDSLWWHNYVAIGLPLIWNALSILPAKFIWPTLAVTQHLIAAGSLVYCLRSLYRTYRSSWFGVAGLLICALPFYQSLHNAFLTESISSSILLLSIGLAVSSIRLGIWNAKFTLGMSICILLGAQFRGTVAIFSLWVGILALIQAGRFLSRHFLVLVLACYFGILLFPAIRAISGGEFIEPRLGPSRLWAALYANPTPSHVVLQKFQTYQWPDEVKPEKLLSDGASFLDVSSLIRFWMRTGASNREALERAENLGSIVMNDGFIPRLHAISYGLSASGMSLQLFLLPNEHQVFRGYNGRALYAHELSHYRYLSWLEPNRDLFNYYMQEFFQKNSLSDSHHLFATALTPYFNDRASRFLRDPMLLGYVLPDLWFIMGIATLLLLLRRNPIVSIMFLGIIAGNVYITGSAPFADVRYSYVLMPLFFLAAVTLITTWRNQPIVISGWMLSLLDKNTSLST